MTASCVRFVNFPAFVYNSLCKYMQWILIGLTNELFVLIEENLSFSLLLFWNLMKTFPLNAVALKSIFLDVYRKQNVGPLFQKIHHISIKKRRSCVHTHTSGINRTKIGFCLPERKYIFHLKIFSSVC